MRAGDGLPRLLSEVALCTIVVFVVDVAILVAGLEVSQDRSPDEAPGAGMW